jgi:membrane-bound lytic murein transglycosylase MltF
MANIKGSSVFSQNYISPKKKPKKRTAAYERRKFASNLEVDLKLTPVNKNVPIFDQKSKTFKF